MVNGELGVVDSSEFGVGSPESVNYGTVIPTGIEALSWESDCGIVNRE